MINVVVAEAFYGEPVVAIGGDDVAVTSVIASPVADPHDYEPAASTVRAVADADLVIYNGLDYDPWMERLLAATGSPRRLVVKVADLIGKGAGDNPHVWYSPPAMPALADAVAVALAGINPADAARYADNAARYKQELAPIAARVAEARARFAGWPVTASEPVFGHMADAIGLDVRHLAFQTAVMNETEPSARSIAEMEADIRAGRIKVLFYNPQVTSPLADRLTAIAREAGVPIVAVAETQPADAASYVDWMLRTLDATTQALARPGA
jgi:zinc/manganese transport system substrate-binding protein